MNAAEEIKQRLDIVGMISEYIELTKAGRNFKGLCPFHTEKTPSFFVFPDRQSWRCFGCNEGGDVISFVMKKEGMSFGEALRNLAPRAGVVLPEHRGKRDREERFSRLYQVNESAAAYYHHLLMTTAEGEKARQYIEARYLNRATIEQFRLGFSPDSWNSCKTHLGQQGYQETDMVAAGLVTEKDGRRYDRFRGRLMFPITDPKGRTIGFGARALDDSMPKYLNSAESPIFAKNAVLYGIDRARNAIREQGKAIIVEGYTDVLTAHQNGFRNVVASMGTALTENQVAILKGLTRHICLALDADTAGSAATLRGIEICRNALADAVPGPKGWLGAKTQLRTEISIINMPAGKDPDEVIRENPGEWERLVDEADSLISFLFESIAREFDLNKPEDGSQFVDKLMPLIAQIGDSGIREAYLTRLGQYTGLSDRVLRGKMADMVYPKKSSGRRPAKTETPRAVRAGDRLEEQCLSLLLKHPHLRPHIEGISSHFFERSENREIFMAIARRDRPEDIRSELDPALHQHFQYLLAREEPPADASTREKELWECLYRLEARSRQTALAANRDIEMNSARLKELWHQH